MHDFHGLLLSSEVRDLTDEVARLFEDLDRDGAAKAQVPVGHCTPPLDVLERDGAIELVLDLPGVAPDSVRVMLKDSVLLVVGEKPLPYASERAEARFHLVERSFGRFARAVRLEGSFDSRAARAELRGGELRVIVPRLVDRRGREIIVPVVSA